MIIDLSQVTNVEIEGIDLKDRPHFSDAFISAATYYDRPMTDEELEELNNDTEFIHSKVMGYDYY